MNQARHRCYRMLFLLLLALCVARTAKAQDYPHYAPAGSTFVPLDSWVYPALDRLAAFGYVTTAIEGMKPWTRTECARLTEEAGDALDEAIREDRHPQEEAAGLHEALAREFATELEIIGGGRNRSFRLESVYARAMSINGPALTDGFHFGQTVAYDFGRPFERGFNSIAGGAWRATAGPFAFYIRAEYQHAPSAPALSDAVRQVIATVDLNPVRPATPFNVINRVALLDAYVSFNFRNWELSFGRQSLSWGVGEGGGMLYSDNAPPVPMLRLTRVVPARLPGFLSGAGPFRTEFFAGRLEGGVVVPTQWFFGQKISFKATQHLEVGYARTSILGGNGGLGADALTWPHFWRNFFAVRYASSALGIPGTNQGSFDALFYIPGTRFAASIYGDLYGKDKPTWVVDPPRGAYRAGIYISRFPKLHQLDFRAESASTLSPVYEDGSNGTLNYFNHAYRDGYTNDGILLGDIVGRAGRTFQGWTTYHFSPTHLLELHFKQQQVSPQFIPGGGRWQDYGARHQYFFKSGMYVKSSLQIEHIASYPLLFSGQVNNVTAAIEIGYAPWGSKP